MEFRWIQWNIDHVSNHGVTPAEAEQVVRRPLRGWPRKVGDKKRMVQGRGQGDRVVQVVYLIDPDKTIFVIHAMPLTLRRRR
jgi:hypothetical protein